MRLENWVFADETSFWINEVPLYHHRHPNTHPIPAGFSSGLKIKINVWGAISCRGTAAYFQILIDHLIPSGYGRYENGWIFHQDNDPKHTSRFCRDLLISQNVLWVS